MFLKNSQPHKLDFQPLAICSGRQTGQSCQSLEVDNDHPAIHERAGKPSVPVWVWLVVSQLPVWQILISKPCICSIFPYITGSRYFDLSRG